MPNIITERFVLVVNKLLRDHKAKSGRQLSMSLDYLPQSLSEVMNSKRDVPVEVIQRMIDRYHINPLFLFMGEGDIYLDENARYAIKTVTLVTDKDNNERIVHVPMPAQAGYAEDLNSLEMMRELPTYTLPELAFQSGTYRSFDVKGDSMEPTIEEHDMLVCSYIEPHLWESSIRDHHVYVIVTRGDIVVKRVINNLRKHKHLELHSDNETFQMYRIQGADIQEVWYVRSKISRFKHHSSAPKSMLSNEEILALHNTIKAQANMILQLQKN